MRTLYDKIRTMLKQTDNSPAHKRKSLSKSLRFEALEDRRLLSVFNVNSPLDIDASNNVLTLREAIRAHNEGYAYYSKLTPQEQSAINWNPGNDIIRLDGLKGDITLRSALPSLIGTVTIQGLQTGSSIKRDASNSSHFPTQANPGPRFQPSYWQEDCAAVLTPGCLIRCQSSQALAKDNDTRQH